MVSTDALARFLISIAAAAEGLARELQAEPIEPEEDRVLPSGLGHRQVQACEILASAPNNGIATGDVAKAMHYDFSNVYLTLRRLEQLGLAERVPGVKPQRWRLARRVPATSASYLVAARQLGKGEWATYGDISVAVRGDDNAAIAVGRAAANLPDFPNPHRVLKAGGVIPPDWHSDDGGGPEECRRRLEREGVSFNRNGRADPARHVGFEELRQRLGRAGQSALA